MSRVLLLFLLLVPCAQTGAQVSMPPSPVAAPTSAADASPVPSPGQVLLMPPALATLLHDRVIAPTSGREERLQRLVEMIFDRNGMDLQYDADATYTIAETWQHRRANCLSFTLLFVTLARAAGIQARVQEVERVASWYKDAGALYSIGHVNAGIEVNGRSGTVDLDRNVLYDRQGPRAISDARALAHFYNNRGAAYLESGLFVPARAAFDAALRQDPAFTATLNNLGVLEARQGHLQQARGHYMAALRVSPRHAPTLANASALLLRLGDAQQAARLQQRLQNERQGDPFVQYMLGVQAERQGDLPRAIRSYRRAVRLYDSAHQFHFALARAYFLDGQPKQADVQLRRALQLGGASQQARYQDKLDSLQRWRLQQASARLGR